MYISIHSLDSILSWSTFGSKYSLKSLTMMLQTWNTYFWAVSSIFLWRTSQTQSGSVGAQTCSDLSRVGSSLGSGWLTRGRLANSPEATHFVILVACLGSLSCWKLNFRPSWKSSALWSRTSSRISLYIATFIFPLTLTNQCPSFCYWQTSPHNASM